MSAGVVLDLDLEQAGTMLRHRERELLRVYAAVASGSARSRRDLATQLSLRASTVSELVADLTDRGYLLSLTGSAGGRGRPATTLMQNAFRYGVLLIQVASRAIRGRALNLLGQCLHEVAIEAPADSGNDDLVGVLERVREALIPAVPAGCTLVGQVLALPGVLDRRSGTWLFSSRWPRMQALRVTERMAMPGLPVHLLRNLDVELAARLPHDTAEDQGTLLLHWGFGIGAAYAIGRRVVNSDKGRFCEIGHWRIGASTGKHCICGDTDCLETVAALWALAPALRARWPDLASDEAGFGAAAATLPLLDEPAVCRGLEELARVLANLCRVLFPDRVVVTGPFTEHPGVWDRFARCFADAPMMRGLPTPMLIPGQSSTDLEAQGAVSPLLTEAVLAGLRQADT